MSTIAQLMIPGFTYHIFPAIAKEKESILQQLEPVIRDGFWGGLQIPPLPDDRVTAALAAELRLAGITAVYGVGGTLSRSKVSLHSRDEENRAAAIELSKELIDQAYLLGASIVDLNPGTDPGREHREAEKELLVDSLVQLCAYAHEKKSDYLLPLSMENFDREADKKLLLGPTAETVEVVAEVRKRYDNIGITADISHLMLLGEDPAESVRQAGDYVLHAHLSNFIVKDKSDPRWGDNHPPHWVTGSEVGPEQIASFLAALEEIGYFEPARKNRNGYRRRLVTFEIRPGEGEAPLSVVAGSRRVLEQAIALLD